MASPVPYAGTESDFADIIIDSATLLIDGTELTLSRGGWSFDPGEEWEDYPFPGRTMNTVGARELVRSVPTIKGTALLSGEDQITAFRPDGTWGDHATIAGARTFTPTDLRTYLTDADYLENVAVVWKRIRGDYIAVLFPIAVCGSWDLGATDGDEGLFRVVFEAVQDTTGVPPYVIRTVPDPTDIPGGGSDGEGSDGEVFAALPIANPGAEFGTASWTATLGALGIRTTANTPGPHSGSRYFTGGVSAETIVHQDVAIPSDWIATVDAGDALLDFSGYQSSFDVFGDQGQLMAQFYNGAMAQVGSDETTTLTNTAATEWTLVSITDAAIPVGTRTVRFTMRMVRIDGVNNDGFFDDLEATIHT